MNYETGVQLGVMDARLKKMRKQRDEYKKQRDELIGDIGKLRERNKELEKQVHGIGIARALKRFNKRIWQRW